MFTLTIQTDNAAFDGDQTYELARILRDLAEAIDGYGGMVDDTATGTVRDTNGYTVGHWTLDPREDD